MPHSKSRGRQKRQVYTTKTGNYMRLNQSISDRKKARKAESATEKALYLSTLPKNRLKRILVRCSPQRIYHFWFSRQGALMSLKIIGIAVFIGFFLTIGLFAYLKKDLPHLNSISGDNLGGSISYYDSTGKVLLFQDYNGIKRVPVASNQISPYMKDATVAIEDKNFYKEGAFDIRSIFRAGLHDLTGGSLQGASTITEQLVKLNEGWIGSRTIATKIKEVILAVEVNREYSKSQILTGYLNIAPYGSVDYGIQAAAEDYFRTSAANLSLPQAAMLAAIPQSPGIYSPYGSTKWNPAASNTFDAKTLINRQHYILEQMVQQGYISQSQAQAAMSVNVLSQVQPEQGKYTNIQDPYFVLAAKQQLINQFGQNFVNKGGVKVITTLNLQLQKYAQQDIANNTANVARVGGDEQAMVAENVKTGQVVAMVGGENFNNPIDGQINYANVRISPGSALKPFMYAALIQNNTNVGAGSVFYDTQSPIPGYPCTDHTRPTLTSNGGNCLWDDNYTYPGPETIRYALAGSRNVPAVKASLEVDPTDNGSDGYKQSVSDWINLANQAMGTKNAYACYKPGVNVENASVTQQTQCYGAAALGAGAVSINQIVNGDATLANMGQELPQTYIQKIIDASGNTIYQWQKTKPTQVYKPDTAYIINSILDDPRATYLFSYQKFQHDNGWYNAVKTGTENQNYNGLMTAWNTQYAVVGFAGYHTLDKPLIEGFMEDITEPITRTWMEQALAALHTKPINWQQPAGIKTLPGFVQTVSTGYGAQVPGPSSDIYPAWYTGKGSNTRPVTIDKVSGYLATSCTPQLARQTIGGSTTSSFSVDIFYPRVVPDMSALESGNTTSSSAITQTDNIHNCNDSPPAIGSISISNSNNNPNRIGACDSSCVITVTASAGSHPLSGGNYTNAPAGTISIKLSGQSICTIVIPPDQSQNFQGSCQYDPTTSGSGLLTATAIDSVLYSSQPYTANLNYTSKLSGLTVTQSGSSLNFNWNGGVGQYNIYISGTSNAVGGNCDPTSSNSCTAPLPTSTSSSYTVEDSLGNTASST